MTQWLRNILEVIALMDRNQKQYILVVVAFVVNSTLLMLGVIVYDRHLRRVAETGPGTISEVHVVHRSDGTSGLLTVAHIKVRQHRGLGAPPLILHRLDVIDAASGERLLRRSWDDDKAWPRCRDAGHRRLSCQSPTQQLHLRSLATLDVLEEFEAAADGQAEIEKPPRDSSRICMAKRANLGAVVFQIQRAETSIREVIEVKQANHNGSRIRTCSEPELIAAEIVCDEATGKALNIGVEKTVVVDHMKSLLAAVDARHVLAAIDAECHVVWQLEVAGKVDFASVVGKVLVALASRNTQGVYQSHLLGIDPTTGTLSWQL